MRNRRDFLADSARVLMGGLAALASYGCEERREKTQRAQIIKQFQQSAKDLVDYRIGEGYVYDTEVDGEKIFVNLSKDHFEKGDRLNYTTGKMLVRVYDDYISVKYEGRLTNEGAVNIYNFAEELTDKVLEAVAQENDRLSKINKSDLLKDLK